MLGNELEHCFCASNYAWASQGADRVNIFRVDQIGAILAYP